MKPSTRDALGLALVLAAAWTAHRFVLELELMGWDAYPTIAASRMGSVAEFAKSFTVELMGGRYPNGSFYRPVVTLSFGVDHAFWGLRPVGYQLTNLLTLMLGVTAVFALARRWLGPGWGALCATFVFALHPLQLETLPVAARRADMLFSLFLLGALLGVPTGDGSRRGNTAWVTACVVLSAASKETGAIALPLVAAAAWGLPRQGSARARARRTLHCCAAPAAGFVLFLILRTSVLGGLGGHPGASSPLGALRGLSAAPEYVRSLLMPQPWTGLPLLDLALLAVLTLALLGAVAGGALAETEVPERPSLAETEVPERPSLARVAALAGFWLLCLLAMTGISGERAAWYAVPFLPPYALLVGCAAAAASAAFHERRRTLAVLGGAIAASLIASHLRFSPLLQHYEAWTRLSHQERSFLERFDRAVQGASPGTTVAVPGLPLGSATPLEQVGIRSAHGLATYSVEAYAELAFPGQPVRVMLHTGDEPTPPTPDSVTVDAVPLPGAMLRAGSGAPG